MSVVSVVGWCAQGDEAVTHGALLYALSRNEPNALGRTIRLADEHTANGPIDDDEEEEGGEGGARRPSPSPGVTPLAQRKAARVAAEEQLFELRERAAAVVRV
eukprot:COSAG01_NODE_15760_length_1302_cov_4.756442_2_plen_103_part_00